MAGLLTSVALNMSSSLPLAAVTVLCEGRSESGTGAATL
jgi:hypothetical protein